MPKNIVPILENIDFFKVFNSTELAKIIDLIGIKKVRKKDVIFHEGDECTAIYFILKGSVKVFKTSEDGRENIVNLLSTHDMFPHVGLFGGSNYPATAKAIEDSVIYYLLVEDFNRILIDSPHLSIKLLQILDQKIRSLQVRLGNVMSKDITDKVISTLHSLAKTNGVRTDEGLEIQIELTHQDLADMVGTTRETVSRVISQLKRDGILCYENSKICLMH